MENCDEKSLVIKHLPPELSVQDRIDFLKYLGATDVRCIVSEFKKTSLTFAQFKSKERCQAVLKSLHQKEILGSLVSVEFAKSNRPVTGESSQVQDVAETTSQRKIVENYLKKLNSWTNSADFSQPPSPHIRYSYPPPSTQVLRNICSVLAKVPKFYTQVLHLMNKMNLPCPFSGSFHVYTDLISDDFEQTIAMDEKTLEPASEESEIESDPESKNDVTVSIQKRIKRLKKVIKIPKVVRQKPVENRAVVRPEEVFESSHVIMPKKIELRVSSDLTVPTETQKLPGEVEGFGLLEPVLPTSDSTEQIEKKDEESAPTGVISLDELEMNRIPSKDFYLLPVFKNYQPGPPTCRLYIKNLAKTVTSTDLEFIFGRYRIEESGDQVNLYDIRLMQEGRMKGQAFVTLQSVELAEQAVKETNGYILKGKAIVVQFARSNKPK